MENYNISIRDVSLTFKGESIHTLKNISVYCHYQTLNYVSIEERIYFLCLKTRWDH